MATRCLVTGGAGFIGSHLVESLLEEGYDVRVLDNFSTGDRRNLLHVAAEIEIVEGDLRSFERVLTATRGCELVFHQAALPSVPRSVQDPLTSSSVNVNGTLNVLLAARDTDVRRVVYASSSSVYGSIADELKREDLPVAPLSPYGVSKLAGESYCASFAAVYGLETVSLRYFNVFGPRQSPISEYAAVIPSFFSAALMDDRPVVYGDGEQCRDFTFVANVVRANVLAGRVADPGGRVYNVGCGSRVTVNELLAAIGAVVGCTLEPVVKPARRGDVRASVADVSRARAELGYEPTVQLDEGLVRSFEYFRSDPSLIPRVRERREWLAVAG